jgi:dihydroorotate dehydrogenase (NAD+) catalytic subunit
MADLTTLLAGIRLDNPTVLASGVLGTSASSTALAIAGGAGAVTLKSCGLEPRQGHRNPCVIPWEHGLLNAVGLANPGVRAMADEVREHRRRSPVPLFASIFGRTVEEFGEVAARMAEAEPDLIEVNVSCPNVEADLGTPFGLDFAMTEAITALVKKRAGGIPVSIKLSPQAHGLGRLARVCQEAGADVITAINTVGPGMIIDTTARRPVLSNRTGGLSGPAILPVAVRAVYEIFEQVTIPIIGTGGIGSADGALQMLMAGAAAVGLGSAVADRGPGIFREVAEGIGAYLDSHGHAGVADIVGVAHG